MQQEAYSNPDAVQVASGLLFCDENFICIKSLDVFALEVNISDHKCDWMTLLQCKAHSMCRAVEEEGG